MQRSLISLVAGGILAVVAIVLLNIYIRNMASTPSSAPIALSTVVVAKDDLPLGTDLQSDMLKMIAWPADSVPDGSFRTIEEVFAGSHKPGDRIVVRSVDRNEPILRSKLSGFGGKATLSREVTPGMRAIAIKVDDVSGVAGFMLPGDRVDIILTQHLPKNGVDNIVSDVILQNITILGIDQLSDQQRDQPLVVRTATVEVTPDQAQKLVLAQAAGTLSLDLRNVTNNEQVKLTHVSIPDLTGTPAPQAKVKHGSGSGVRVMYGDGSSAEHSFH